MSFSVTHEPGTYPVITLQGGNSTAAIYAQGALLNAFTLTQNGQSYNVIDGFASPQEAADNITAGFKSACLLPFVCRITGGRYVFESKEYQLNKFFLGNEAIHGLLFDAPFTVTSSHSTGTEAFVTLEYDYDKEDDGYPFAFHTKITYTLSGDNKLTIGTEITNTGNLTLPLTVGWHPYFTLGGNINELLFTMNTSQVLEFNEHLVPTGNILANTTFASQHHIDETFLDNCFILNDTSKPACILSNEANGLQLTIHAGESYPYLQVYTPPHRKSIAIENLSGAPDAFNNGIGLIIAKPGELYTFAASYSLNLSR